MRFLKACRKKLYLGKTCTISIHYDIFTLLRLLPYDPQNTTIKGNIPLTSTAGFSFNNFSIQNNIASREDSEGFTVPCNLGTDI